MSPRRAFARPFVLVAGLVLALVATAAPANAASTVYRESFETGFGSWTPDSDGLVRDWSIKRENALSHQRPPVDGAWQLSFYLDGRNDDGTIWIERTIDLPAGDVGLTMTFWLSSASQGSVNTWPVVAYAGEKNPSLESDFTSVGHTEQAVGWTQYKYGNKFSNKAATTIYVAVGISATWETERTYPVDLVEITVDSA
jgi:hypothetical protein